ncbi:MAG: DNA-3-methyladenine glycosylase 2 family protein [Bacteroidetes bacterium]|nr:DNA-3-methyladenine glycosylase 2 family protein [Bacteroidota bacterium]MCW5896881.1 DNA-3-methyladenine glycosylase 2 family protein [Bacteroidota bacterium]
MQETVLTITTPANFHFWRTAYSHGWCDLPPFSHDTENEIISRVLTLDSKARVLATLSASRMKLRITTTSAGPLSSAQRKEIISQVRTCLRLDEDFSEFHRAARKIPAFRWIATTGSGRMLRSPTVFEDVVKMICTTNCTWALTKIMVGNLVGQFGDKFNGTLNTFPTPEAIAASSDKYLRKEIKSGYRSPYLIELAERVASGELDLESWRTSDLPTDELFKHMRQVKGIGPYAAGNIMKLIGRYDYLGLDSWVRAQYYKQHRKGRAVKDSTIEKHYEQFGTWRGLFFWLEMTRYWHDDKFTA